MQYAVINFFHHHRFSERSQIYAAISLKMLGISIFAIFIPIYLFKIGYDLQHILLFFVLDYSLRLGLQWLAGWYIAKYGPKHGLVVSAASTITTLLLFYTLPSMHWPLLLLAAMSAVSNVFHFLGYFVDFAQTQDVMKSGKSAGTMAQLIIFASSLGPFVGGLVSDQLGVGWTLLAAAIIVLASLIPLLSSRDLPKGNSFQPRRLPLRQLRYDFLSNFGKAWDIRTASVVWPLALFFVVHSYQGVGLVASLSFLGIIATAHIVTNYVDRFGWPMLVSGTAVNAMVHLTRTIISTLNGAILLNLVGGVVTWVAHIPWQAEVYRHAKAVGPVEYFTVFNFTSDCGSAIFWLILFGVSTVASMQTVFTVAFLLAAIGALGSPLIVRKRGSEPLMLRAQP